MSPKSRRRFFIPLGLISLFLIGYGPIYEAMAAGDFNTENGRVSIKLTYLPSKVKIGDKPIGLTEEILGKLLPELKNPRLMGLADLGDINSQWAFLEEGYTFVLRGDFNNDGNADLTFVGKYDDSEHPTKNTFLAIVSFRGDRVVRDYFLKLQKERVSLLKEIDFKPNIDGIFMGFVYGSDHCAVLYWTGQKYQIEMCRSDY